MNHGSSRNAHSCCPNFQKPCPKRAHLQPKRDTAGAVFCHEKVDKWLNCVIGPSGRTAGTVKRDNERLKKRKILEVFFYPFFGIGGSEWHLLFPWRPLQVYTPANACALATFGMIAVLFSSVEGEDSYLSRTNNSETTTVTEFHLP